MINQAKICMKNKQIKAKLEEENPQKSSSNYGKIAQK